MEKPFGDRDPVFGAGAVGLKDGNEVLGPTRSSRSIGQGEKAHGDQMKQTFPQTAS
jgi:hypothetical protein